MERKILKAGEGMILTDGVTFGSEIYLGDGMDASSFYEIPESEIVNLEEVNAEAYKEALEKLGVDIDE